MTVGGSSGKPVREEYVMVDSAKPGRSWWVNGVLLWDVDGGSV